MPAKQNPSLAPPKRERIEANVSPYLEILLDDYDLAIAIHKLWPDLERILLAVQRGLTKVHGVANAGPVCEAVDQIVNTFQLFAEQGKLDLDFIKSLPKPN